MVFQLLLPVIMVSTGTGAFLEAAIAAGTITQAFIGNKAGLFANDLGVLKSEALRARRFSNLAALSTNATEFSVPAGAWVRNYGSGSQTGGQLIVSIDFNASEIWADSAIVPTLAPGDSAWIPLATFSQANYTQGYYDMKYTVITNPVADEENSDNVIDVAFMIDDSLYSYARVDQATLMPLSPAQSTGGNATGWEACMAFQDPNASRMIYNGINFTALSFDPNLMANEFIEAKVYQWNDVFTDVNDAALNFSNLLLLDNAFFAYADESLQDVNVFVPRDGNTWSGNFVDNQRYLFCISSASTTLLLGMSNSVDYELIQNDPVSGHLQPSMPASVDQAWFRDGFGLDFTLAATVQMDIFTGVDELDNEISISSFPNPAVDVINIPVGDRNGSATIELYDIAGKLVISNNVTFTNNQTLTLDVSTLSNGSYVAKMIFEDATATFNVVVSK